MIRLNVVKTYTPTYGHASFSCIVGNKLCSYILQHGDTLETASRIATKKKTAEAREEFRKAEDQAASAKALATAAKLTVEASTVIFKAATAYLKALIAAAKKVVEVNT